MRSFIVLAPLSASLLLVSAVLAQAPAPPAAPAPAAPPPAGAPAPPATPTPPGAPAPGTSPQTGTAAAPSAAPTPGATGAPDATPGALPAGATPPSNGAQPVTGGNGAGASATLGAQVGVAGTSAATGTPATSPATSASNEPDERTLSLEEQNSISGGSGLLRTLSASSGAVGTFRVSTLFDGFSTSDFLCSSGNACITPDNRTTTSDSSGHYGMTLGLSFTPLEFLEGFAALHSYANSNDQWQPQLLQVLGDTTLGVKVFTPKSTDNSFTFGGSVELLFLNASGGVGVNGGATSARFKLFATADMRQPHDEGTPLRFHLNLGYLLDNSGKLVEDVEAARDTHIINRIERFGLGINRVDQILFSLGIELPFPQFRPFAEWDIGIPANRQGYVCDPVRTVVADQCLGVSASFSAFPSQLVLGARIMPWLKGLSATAAIDIGTTGSSSFLEELAPTPPWDLWFGLGYAYDTVEPAPKTVAVEKPAPPPHERRVRGFVHEKDKGEGLANVIIKWDGLDRTAMATGSDGRFVTSNVEPGPYRFAVRASGYEDTTCSINVPLGGPGATSAPAPSASAPPAATLSPIGPPPPPVLPGAPASPPLPGAPASPTPQSTSPMAASESSHGVDYFDIDCALEPSARTGNIVGRVVDADGQAAISGALAHIVDTQGRSIDAPLDASGAFRVEGITPGTVAVKAEADGYMVHVQPTDVRPREDTRVEMLLHKKPGLVKVTAREIRIKQQVHFEIDSAKIMTDSSTLLEEVADAIIRNPNLHRIEIQGHTDNTGPAEHNKTLSEQRAEAVRTWLVDHGVEPGRLTAKGYGQEKPLMPNTSEAGKSKNRRVQLMIIEREGATIAPAAPSTPKGGGGGGKKAGGGKKPALPF